jgi:error-prone DNA polymerase
MPEFPPSKRWPDGTPIASPRSGDIPGGMPGALRGHVFRQDACPPKAVGMPPGMAPGPSYAELRCRTNFSFLEGASHPDELVQRAAELGYTALAITDRNSLAGVVRAHEAAKPAGLKLVIGAEVTPEDAPPILLWVTDRAAYGRLARLLTRGRRAAPKGECLLTLDDVAEHAQGLLAGVPLRQASTEDLLRYRDIFGDRCYAAAELHRGPDDGRLLQQMLRQGREARLPVIAANNVHYHVASRRALQDVLTAIRHGCSVAELGKRIFPNAERHLKALAAMAELFAAAPRLVARTVEVASRCTFSLEELRYEYPEELCPPGLTPLEHLTRLTREGAARRYPDGVPDKVSQLVEHELALIDELHYEAYFLTVWDLVRFAREREILCQGRGSAANSAVCFCLGVTEVDPDRIDVLFERFISKERNEPPDIDVDFEHERREEVIQYVYDKYGRDRAGMTAEVITYRMRSAVRDVGKALGLSADRIDALANTIDHHHDEAKAPGRFREAGLSLESDQGRQLLALVRQILGFPRHLSQHVGGMVVTRGPLCEMVPIENAAMPERTVVEWDKDDLDALGILKVDCLALGMLTAIRRCFHFIERHNGRQLTLANVPAEDPAVYDMMGKADTIGVFQIESRAQMSMLPRLKPRCFYDLVIEVAIVRPGPIQGKMVHPYLRRRSGDEPADYPDDRVRAVLEKTLGVPIFQEQAMRLVVVAAGFTPGEADQLRRAMGAWHRKGAIEPFRDKLLNGMRDNGYSPDFADRVFQQIQGFGDYGFPESHAASFALLAYVSAWLKRYYPAAFAAALINSQPMGFYAPAQLVADAKKHGVGILPIDVNFSDYDCTLEPPELRLGLRMVSGLGQGPAEAIMQARADGPFTSFEDLAVRTGLRSGSLKALARADAFGSLRLGRRAALWQSLPPREPAPLFQEPDVEEPPATLPPVAPLAEVLADYGSTGLTLRQHPVSFFRQLLDRLRVVPAAHLVTMKPGCRLKVAGIVLLRQRPGTANGITFVTLEDESGMVNLIVRQEIWERYRRVARTAVALLAYGQLQREADVIHVLVTKLEDFSAPLATFDTKSRDFR